MKILITGNMGHVGPMVLRRLRESHREAELIGYDTGYRHDGFWSCMDTLREKNTLEELWQSSKAPWKIW